jgi:hypothetical protein
MPDPRADLPVGPPSPAATAATGGGRDAARPDHPADLPDPADLADLAGRIREAAGGLAPLVDQAASVRAARAEAYGAPRWTDVFTTQFTEFSNRPR